MTVIRMNVSNEVHDNFVKTHPNGDMLQLSTWADTKRLTGWYSRRIAVGRNNELAGVGQLLFKKVPKTPFTMCYVSRGFVCDYHDKEVVAALVDAAIEVARREKSYSIKIDPDVEVDTVPGLVEFMNTLGFVHKGFKDGLHPDYIQPRMTMITDIDMDEDALIQSFEKRNRSTVKQSLKKGAECEIGTRDDLKIFAQLMKETGERDGFLVRDISYFETIYDALNPAGDAELFLTKLVPGNVLQKLNETLKKNNDEKEKVLSKKQTKKTENQLKEIDIIIEKLQEQIKEMEELQKTHPDGKYLAGAILTFCGKKAYYLYAASSNEYRGYLPNHKMQVEMMKYAREKGATSYDFGGTDNNPDKDSDHYGLWQFKKSWGTRLSEKVGEFDYVLNKPVYTLIEVAKPKVKSLTKKINMRR
ncbi:N-acetyltransferase [Macrococcoides canis]|nr:N-acetyltransferase [Macrococcus canis]